ncbi:MAG: hypothetical protein KDN22_02255 [Verrucomicrobiae bacterium]|nr:hypothetical protein [Verrucomicrobiae bacterium]
MSTTQERSNSSGRERARGGRNRGGNRSGGRRRNDNRRGGDDRRSDRPGRSRESRSTPRTPRTPPLTLGQKIIKVLTFGLVNPTPKRIVRPVSPTAKKRSNPQGSAGERTSAPKKAVRREPKARESRAPELREVVSGRLYVGNLSYDATESDLMDLFNGVGQVQTAEVVSHKRTMRSKGYAFVQMLSIDEARRAVDVLHDKEFMGRPLVVSGAKAERPADRDDDQ